MIRAAVPVLVLTAACATSAAASHQDPAMQRVERTLTGLTPGEPRRCLDRNKVTELRTARGVILYVGGKNRVWRNDVVGEGCIGLARGDIVVSLNPTGDYCRGDLVRTRSPSGGGFGSCALGMFVPYTRAK